MKCDRCGRDRGIEELTPWDGSAIRVCLDSSVCHAVTPYYSNGVMVEPRPPTDAAAFTRLVDAELARARKKHPAPLHSVEEGYAVILEELDEFWDEVRKQHGARSKHMMLAELVQVAAMARRVSEDVLAELRSNNSRYETPLPTGGEG